LTAIILLTSLTLASISSTAWASEVCSGDLKGNVVCHTTNDPVGPSSPGVLRSTAIVTSSTECGPRLKAFNDGQFEGSPACANYLRWCPLSAGAAIDPMHEIVVYEISDAATKQFLRIEIGCDIPVGARMPTIAAIKAEIVKRAPQPRAAAGGTDYVVNPAIVFYLTSTVPDLTHVTIPRFELGGHQFTATLDLASSVWIWGDGTNATARSDDASGAAGKPYTNDDPCESVAVCSHYVAHPYQRPGHYTITATAHWTGTFTADNSNIQIPIHGDIFRADNAGTQITVHEASAVLVPPSR
jgi:hypothetical protein